MPPEGPAQPPSTTDGPDSEVFACRVGDGGANDGADWATGSTCGKRFAASFSTPVSKPLYLRVQYEGCIIRMLQLECSTGFSIQ
jgi:hypothetical protein